jgi:hypothetical protein
MRVLVSMGSFITPSYIPYEAMIGAGARRKVVALPREVMMTSFKEAEEITKAKSSVTSLFMAIRLETKIKIKSVEPFDRSMVVAYDNRQETFSLAVSECLLVEKAK